MKAGIVGGSGYVGGELIRLLLGHPKVELAFVTSRKQAGKKLSEAHPNLEGITGLKYTEKPGEADLAFTATPHTETMGIVKEILETGTKVVDLSADFRLSAEQFEKAYGVKHTSPDLLEKAEFGIPELNKGIKKATLVSCPGCFATGSILALYPFKDQNVEKIVIDACTGSSGSGATPSEYCHHPERALDVKAYSPQNHRHIPEIEQAVGKKIFFTPHSLPIVRGIFTTAHVFGGFEDAQQKYKEVYGDEYFVRIIEEATLASVLHSNFCNIQVVESEGHTVVMSVIDNLVKGAAGQAVQNMNLMSGFNEKLGLGGLPFHPA